MKSTLKVRLHPDPLPQKRENYSPRLGEMNALGIRTRSESDGQEAGPVTRDSESSRMVATPSLSPGERAGVRASVSSNPVLSRIKAVAFQTQ